MMDAGLVEDFKGQKPPWHAALLSGSARDCREAARAFIQFCIADGRQCRLIQPASSLPAWARDLGPPNLVSVRSWKALPTQPGPRTPDDWKAILLDFHQEALRAGFPGFNLLLDARRLREPAVATFEMGVADFLSEHPAAVLCLSQVQAEAEADPRSPLSSHPWLVVKGRLCENIFYLSPPKARRRKAGAALRAGLEQVEEFNRRRAAWERQDRLLRIVDEIAGRFLTDVPRDTIMALACEKLLDLGFRLAWVGAAEPDGRLRLLVARGSEDGFLQSVSFRWDETPEGNSPAGLAVRRREVQVLQDLKKSRTRSPWREPALARGYRAWAAFPLLAQGKVLGVLNVLSDRPGAFGPAELQEVKVLADRIALARRNLLQNEEKARTEARFQKLVESARDVVFLVSPEGRALYVNPAMTEVLGYAPEEFYADPGLAVKIVHPEDRPRMIQGFNKLRRGEDDHQPKQLRWIHRDGHLVYTEHTRTVLFDQEGRLLEIIGIGRDITARQQAEAALRASEARYRALFEYAHEALALGTVDGKILDANPAAARMTGYSRGELIGMSVVKLTSPRDRERVQETLRTFQGPDLFQGEFECLRKDRSLIQVEVRGSRFAMEGEERIMVMGQDVTGRRQAEAQVREAEERYRSLVESCPEGIAFGVKGRIQFANPAFAALFGFASPREVTEVGIMELVAPEERERLAENIKRRAKGKYAPSRYAFYGLHRSGKLLDIEVSVSQFTMGGELYTQVLMREVGERKLAEAALVESEEKYRRLTAAAPAVICRLSPQGQTLYVNKRVVTVTGYRPEEVTGRNWWQVFYPGELRDQVDQLYRDFGTGDVSGYEMTLQGKDGRRRTLAWNSANLVGPGGVIQEIVGVGLDVTALRQDEAEQARLREQLLEVQKMEAISTLAGGIAHHFNNLLGAILGYTSLLKLKLSESDPSYRPLDVIEQAAERASELSRELLSFSRSGAYVPAPTDLNRVTRSVLALVTRSFDPAVAIEFQLQDNLWPILGDAAQLEPLLLNLCLHGRDAMPEGGRLTLSTQNLILDEEFARQSLGLGAGAYVVLAVRDTGPGISAAEQDRIFEPFFALADGVRNQGLGLAMVYGIVKGHGGQIQVESKTRPAEDRGTCFRIYFPALPEARLEAGKVLSREAPRGRETVLVVDDEVLVRELLGQELAFLGYRPLLAAGGEEAGRLLRQHLREVDLVILDWIMPGQSGKDTFRQLREIKPSLKVLLSSGYSREGPIQEALRAGAHGFIQKPYLLQELAQTLRGLFDRKSDHS